MKRILLFFLCALSLNAIAQPDIKKNIYIADKHCKPPGWLNVTTYVPNVDLYTVTYGTNILTPSSDVDIVLYRIDATNYDTLWSRAYGGSLDDRANELHLKTLPNGHLLIAGTTKSYDMDFASNPYQGGRAVHFMELDTLGNVVRTRMLNSNSGFTGNTIRDVIVDDLGNIYATGDTWNDNMDFAHVANGKDAWILKLDSTLTREWMRFWVGYDSDQPGGMGFIQNGNIAVTGVTSDTGTVAMLSNLDHGQGDLYIEAYSPQGVTLWNGRFGGTEFEVGRKVAYAPNSDDIYVIGETNSATGEIGYHTALSDAADTNKLENQNIWILKLDTMGNLEYSKAYGSRRYSNYQPPATNYRDTQYRSAIFYNGNLWVGAFTDGGGGDIDTNIRFGGGSSIWFGLFDNKANLIGKHTINEDDGANLSQFLMRNNNLYGIGTSETGGLFTNTFSCDTTIDDIQFIIKLNDAPLSIFNHSKTMESRLFKLYPNPSRDNIKIELLDNIAHNKKQVVITDANGKQIHKMKISKRITSIDCSSWATGTYYIKMQSKENKQTQLFIKR